MHHEIQTIDIDWSMIALVELLTGYSFTTVLDVGSGAGSHSAIMSMAGKEVVSIDKYADSADVQVDILDYDSTEKFDCIFCSHVVEHQRNCGLFLDKLHELLEDNGILCITGPSHDHDLLVEGHLHTWTAPIALQNLTLSGFDCSKAFIYRAHETGVICRKSNYFETATAAYEFINRNLWPFQPKVGKMANEQGIFFWGNTKNTYTIGTDRQRQQYTVNVFNGVINKPFGVSSKRFSNTVYIFQ